MLQLSNCICLINCCEDDCEAEVILFLQVKLSVDRWTPTMRTPERVRSLQKMAAAKGAGRGYVC